MMLVVILSKSKFLIGLLIGKVVFIVIVGALGLL